MDVTPEGSTQFTQATGADLARDTVAFRRILIPLDGSSLAECVAGAATSLAARFHARAILLHVLERGAPATVHGDRHLRQVEEAERYLRAVQSRWGAPPPVELEWHVHPNEQRDVPGSIVEHANDLDVDLILLSTHGAGGTRRALFGSVAQQVLRKGARPVLLVRPPTTPGESSFDPRLIFVPLDGVGPSAAALPIAGTLARAYGAVLQLFTVVPTLGSVSGERTATALLTPSATALSLDLEETQAKDQLEGVVAQLRAAGLQVSGAVRRGEPAQAILEEVRRRSPDMIVMATHAHTGLDLVFSGSVAAAIAGKVTQPILWVRIHNDAPAR
jgi:nucleotide-binding universal stress UspA family protein